MIAMRKVPDFWIHEPHGILNHQIKWQHKEPELGTFEWCILGLMLDPLFFFISRLNNACSPLVINLQINELIGIKNIPFKSFQLSMIIYDQNRVETFFGRVYRIEPLRDNKSSLSSLVSDKIQSSIFFSKKCWIPAIYFNFYFAS